MSDAARFVILISLKRFKEDIMNRHITKLFGIGAVLAAVTFTSPVFAAVSESGTDPAVIETAWDSGNAVVFSSGSSNITLNPDGSAEGVVNGRTLCGPVSYSIDGSRVTGRIQENREGIQRTVYTFLINGDTMMLYNSTIRNGTLADTLSAESKSE